MSDDELRAKIAGLADASMTVRDVTPFAPWDQTAPPVPVPMVYITPTRDSRWQRWRVLEYAGPVVSTGPGQFSAAGPLERTLHSKRFWFYRSAKRYIVRYLASRKEEQGG